MKRLFFYFFYILAFFFLLSSCSSPVKKPVVTLYPKKNIKTQERSRVETFYNYFEHWQGTPYRMGGLSKKGVDCSGFVYLTYRSVAGIKIPRTTLQQMRIGVEVSPQHLKTGDLLFFKTGWKTRHVGIYLENGQFMHASTSQGVILSGLSEKYWRDAFYLAKRININ